MWVEIEGVKKKVACGPCIRGHRSSKCDHKDRVLQEVRKPGRPLSSCPHPAGTCSCGPISISYTIPKTSSCACPADSPVAATPNPPSAYSSNGNRVQKSRSRKSTSVISPSTLEKALNASGQGDLAPPSATERPPSAFAQASEPTSSTGGSPASSTSSTPHIGPISPRRQSQSETKTFPTEYRAVAVQGTTTSSCCQPKAAIEKPPAEPQGGSCCSSKNQEPKEETVVKKSCCSEPKENAQTKNSPTLENRRGSQPPFLHHFPMNGPFPPVVPMQIPSYGPMSPGAFPPVLMHPQSGNAPGNFPVSPAFGYIAPMYGNPAIYQQAAQMVMQNGQHATTGTNQTNSEHNCHCGDSCNCFGCATHPQNPTTIAHLLDLDNYMRNGGSGSSYVLPRYPHQPPQISQQPYGYAYYPPTQGVHMPGMPQGIPFQFNPNQIPGMYPPNGAPHPWPQSGHQLPVQSTPTTELEHFTLNRQRDDQSQTPRPSSAKQEESSDSPAYEDSPCDVDNEPTLSPSSFFLQTLVLPGCNDVTGTCQCGDGCDCVGCLTHGGHDGIPLETPTDLQPPDFDSFMADTAGLAGQAGEEQFFPT